MPVAAGLVPRVEDGECNNVNHTLCALWTQSQRLSSVLELDQEQLVKVDQPIGSRLVQRSLDLLGYQKDLVRPGVPPLILLKRRLTQREVRS